MKKYQINKNEAIGEIIFQFPNNIKIIIRQLEKLEKKE